MNSRWLRLLCAGALALTSLLAHAQYSWIDDKGARVFSDRPPPPGTPAARILKMPRGLDPLPARSDAGTAAPAAAAAKPAPTLADRDEAFRKRAAQREVDEKKAAEEASGKAAKDENCENARETERTLNTGMRITRVNEKGEKVFLSDEERAQRMERARAVLKTCR